MRLKIDDLIGQSQTREILFATDNITTWDADKRTVNVAFSSESPVERWFGNEILSHNPDSVDLSRLMSGAPVLVGHDADDQVGVVESAHIDPDHRGRAILRFGQSQRSKEIYQDIVDGIRQKISVGYIVNEYTPDENGNVVATKWQPIEISTVSIPADDSVGVGRSINLNFKESSMTDKTTEPAIDVKEIEKQAQRSAIETERKRVSAIADFAERHQLHDLGKRFANEGKSVEEFREAAFVELEKRYQERAASPVTKIDMTANEVKEYSLMRAVNAMATGNWKGAELEQEAHQAVEDRLGRSARGIYVPWEVQIRAQATSTQAAGGALVGTEHRSGSFIELLRANSVVIGLGANVIGGLVGNVEIPKQTSATTAYWVGEGGDVTNSQAAFGTVALAPRTVGVATPVTRRLMLQSDPSIDALLMNDMAIQMALAIDYAILEGDGVNRPLGVVNVTGVATSTIASAGSPTYAELVEFETDVDTSNALTGNLAYVTTPAVRGNLKITAKEAGSGIYLLENGLANGYPVATTSQLTANRIIFGNFADIVIGQWGVLDIMVDEANLAASGGKVLRAFQDMDSAVRHAESFCVNA